MEDPHRHAARAFLWQYIAQELKERLALVTRELQDVLLIGPIAAFAQARYAVYLDPFSRQGFKMVARPLIERSGTLAPAEDDQYLLMRIQA
mgnify:CR=1 FL=1